MIELPPQFPFPRHGETFENCLAALSMFVAEIAAGHSGQYGREYNVGVTYRASPQDPVWQLLESTEGKDVDRAEVRERLL